jgi:hypothetical protein
MSKPAVILVGADKGGVGKTMVTRTLLDYFDARNVRRRAFDTEFPRGTLKRFHPTITDIVDITSVADQMRIFDTINSSGVTVVDIRAGLLSSTLQALDNIGFVEASRNGQLILGIVHILGPSIASLDEINEVARYITDGGYFLVKNHINNTSFFDWDPATQDSYFNQIKGTKPIVVPHLNEMACEQIEIASVPFSSFIADKSANGKEGAYSFVLRGYARHWLGAVWAEYDRVKLNELVAAT